jgi:hypothetical protein
VKVIKEDPWKDLSILSKNFSIPGKAGSEAESIGGIKRYLTPVILTE